MLLRREMESVPHCLRWGEREQDGFRGTVPSHGDSRYTETARDDELGAGVRVAALVQVPLALPHQDAKTWYADLPAVRVTREYQRDVPRGGGEEDVRVVRDQDAGCAPAGSKLVRRGQRRLQIGTADQQVVDAREKETIAFAFDRDRGVVQNADTGILEQRPDSIGLAGVVIVVAEYAEGAERCAQKAKAVGKR